MPIFVCMNRIYIYEPRHAKMCLYIYSLLQMIMAIDNCFQFTITKTRGEHVWIQKVLSGWSNFEKMGWGKGPKTT